ncbi:MAG: hypothetical protein WC688_04020 [Parachlamydiales bacterium]|jgi:hypothetical protein
MKHFCLSVLLFLVIFSGKTEATLSNELENKFEIQQKIILKNSLFIVGQDNSMWEVFCFDLRSQTWSEWWNNIEVKIQGEFIWDNNCWQVGDQLGIEKNNFGEINVETLNEKDRDKYYAYPYLLINTNSNKIAFARPVSFEALINTLLAYGQKQYQEGYDDGYNQGYHFGHSVGYYSGRNLNQ